MYAVFTDTESERFREIEELSNQVVDQVRHNGCKKRAVLRLKLKVNV